MDSVERISTYFEQYAREHPGSGPLPQLVRLLALQRLEPVEIDRVWNDYGLSGNDAFRGQMLDLVLAYVEDALAKAPPNRDLAMDANLLRWFFRIPDGEFAERRPAEVEAILSREFERILTDSVVDSAEELQQVELQAAFGISYDDYLRFTKAAFEHAVTLDVPDFALGPVDRSRVRKELAVLAPLYGTELVSRSDFLRDFGLMDF